jgi:hypothetical protein
MLAEKIADEVAKSGALKIGPRLFASHPDLLHSLSSKMAPSSLSAPPPIGKI